MRSEPCNLAHVVEDPLHVRHATSMRSAYTIRFTTSGGTRHWFAVNDARVDRRFLVSLLLRLRAQPQRPISSVKHSDVLAVSQVAWLNPASWTDLVLEPDARASPVEDARGWPFLCVWCCLDLDAAGNGVAIGGIVIPGQASPNDLTKLRVLPYRPIWWGLLGNTLVYAAAWMLLVFGFTVPRRWLRVRRSQCRKCAYDLRSLPDSIELCPECGTSRPIARKASFKQHNQNNPGP